MVVESLAILLILGAMEFIFLRAHRKSNAVQIAPLLILPGGHFLANLMPDLIPAWTISVQIKSLIDILCMTVAVALMGFFGAGLKSKKTRAAYLLTCGGFTLLLGLIFLYNDS